MLISYKNKCNSVSEVRRNLLVFTKKLIKDNFPVSNEDLGKYKIYF